MQTGKKFSIKAVVIGVVVDIAGSLGVGLVVGIFFGVYFAVKGVPPEGIEGALYSSFGFLLASLLIGLFFSGLGGYIAARIAKTDELKHAFVVGVLSELLAIPVIILSESPTPPAYNIVSLILVIPIAVLGGYLAKPSRTEAPR